MPALGEQRGQHAIARGRPACSGLTMVPKFSFRPDAEDAAMASACAVAAAFRPSSRAAPAAALSAPSVDVQCHPR
jgi:hypothetical protein